tara:strand:+ start:1575 stop:2531 length:957 start_codon:yes stop_codon:yes gene_type:complete
MRKLYWILISVVALFFIFVILGSDSDKTPVPPGPSGVDWEIVRSENVAVTAEGWGAPVYVGVSDEGWEDSVYVSGDGNKLYFTYYPDEDLLAAVASGDFADDLDIYVSEIENGEFRTKRKVTDYFTSEDVWSEVGPMIDEDGNMFYDSNRDWINDQESDQDVWRNDERLAFNTDEEHGNSFYCKAMDELYMGFPPDNKIGVIKNAAANNWVGPVELLPAPINQGGGTKAFQATLTTDCQTLYFTSSLRGGDVGDKPGFSGIYKSERNGEIWEGPEFVVSGKVLVGESSITNDGQRLYFLQVFESDGKFTSDIFYTERI